MTTNRMTWGFSGRETTLDRVQSCVGPGWSKLISDLVDDIFALGWDGTIYQVKEKFGGLRFYIGQAKPEIFDRIHQAENQSMKICEECGEPGELYHDGWIKCLCPVHAAAQGREKDDDED
jgi:hypothetical protein